MPRRSRRWGAARFSPVVEAARSWAIRALGSDQGAGFLLLRLHDAGMVEVPLRFAAVSEVSHGGLAVHGDLLELLIEGTCSWPADE